uniref:ABI family, member 3 (NESH) binding protein b n=1 Tax=Xiphophorus couchianus TaxID=32473 RepID=A0A3B5LUK1_9TELE
MVALLLRVLLLLLIGGTVLLGGSPAQRIRVRRQNMKVRINATGDTIVMKFVRPGPDVKLEGYILGYGRNHLSPNAELSHHFVSDAEPKYLVAVQPIPVNDMKKHCTGKVNLEKPLHLVIGSISPTAVLLSWGNHLKTPYEKNWDRVSCLFYTIRYRERNRKWIYQTCPASDTVIDHLKPDTQYEFGVLKDEFLLGWRITASLLSVPEKGNSLIANRSRPAERRTAALPKLLPTSTPPANITVSNFPSRGGELQTTRGPSRAPDKLPNPEGNFHLHLSSVNILLNDLWLLWFYFDRTGRVSSSETCLLCSTFSILTAAVRPQDGSSLLRLALANERAKLGTWGNLTSCPLRAGLALSVCPSVCLSVCSSCQASGGLFFPQVFSFTSIPSSVCM